MYPFQQEASLPGEAFSLRRGLDALLQIGALNGEDRPSANRTMKMLCVLRRTGGKGQIDIRLMVKLRPRAG